MESAHGQLSARFTNRLSSNYAHSFTTIHQAATTEVAAITLGADTETGFASQRSTYLDFVHTLQFKLVDNVFVQHFTSLGQNRAGFGMQYVLSRRTAQDTIAQGLDHLASFNDGAHVVAVVGAAILLGHHQVLRYVHQTTCQIARVGCFQCGIGQAFARTVCGDEILQHVQTLAEVGRDRCFDNGAVRLGHQTTHTRHLANLCG